VVAKWRKHRVTWMLGIGAECTAAAFHPSGDIIAVGTDNGYIVRFYFFINILSLIFSYLKKINKFEENIDF